MPMHDVNEFIVVAPANMAKAVQWAEVSLRSYLEGYFPHYLFRIEPFGPFALDDEFTVIPVMNRPPQQGEHVEPDQLFMGHLDPNAVPEIRSVLRTFNPTAGVH